MKPFISILTIFLASYCYSQEVDIFQNDSIYLNNRIKSRTMYQTNGGVLQKEMVTKYNLDGQLIKRYWFWNGESDFHNVETFYYSKNNLLSSIVDSSADGNIEKTTFNYDSVHLKSRVTIDINNDTTDFRIYPDSNTVIHQWYSEKMPYRVDTTVFEKEHVKLKYYGADCSREKCFKWRYTFLNQFDRNGNLVKVWSGTRTKHSSYTKYIYDKRNLLVKKQEIYLANKKTIIRTEYTFTYE